MGQITVVPCGIEGLLEIQPTVHRDARGYFIETYNKRDMEEAGLTMEFVQDNQSASSKGVLRGLHYQKQHPQGKLVRVIRGEVFDVAVDLRADSGTAWSFPPKSRTSSTFPKALPTATWSCPTTRNSATR